MLYPCRSCLALYRPPFLVPERTQSGQILGGFFFSLKSFYALLSIGNDRFISFPLHFSGFCSYQPPQLGPHPWAELED